MCGIVGYIGQNDAYSVLIEGLKKLEYRLFALLEEQWNIHLHDIGQRNDHPFKNVGNLLKERLEAFHRHGNRNCRALQ